jgi:steroid delta-isomerase-like uncharacterized protein
LWWHRVLCARLVASLVKSVTGAEIICRVSTLLARNMKPSTESNKTVVRRFVEELWNRGDLSGVEEIVAPNFVMHDALGSGSLKGPAGVRKEFEVERAMMPDQHFELHEIIAEGDLVACRATLTGTPPSTAGAASGVPRKVSLRGMNFFHLSSGRITDEWWVYDSSERWWAPGSV